MKHLLPVLAVLSYCLSFLLVFPPPPAAAGVVERVSVASGGDEADNQNRFAAMSANGLVVAFNSSASNLVPPGTDTNNQPDIFVRDRITGVTSRVSVATDGTQANGASLGCAISADGRYVVFESYATNLVAGGALTTPAVYLHDRTTGTTEAVSVTPDGKVVRGGRPLSVSADGRWIGFTSFYALSDQDINNDGVCDKNCDTNGVNDAYVRDREKGVTIRASVAGNGAEANGNSTFLDMSPDGRYVLFTTSAVIGAGDNNGVEDVFVRDMIGGTTSLVSHTPNWGVTGNGGSNFGAVSDDGRFVAFDSAASDLVAGDTNESLDVFVLDRAAGTTSRVSVVSGGGEADSDSFFADISGDGRFVSFVSYAGNLVPNDTNFNGDVFVHDRVTGVTTRMSEAADGTVGSDFSGQDRPTISGDGMLVAFDSPSANLVAGDSNNQTDIFVAGHGRVDLVQAVHNRTARNDGQPGFSLVAGKNLAVRAFLQLAPDAQPTAVQGLLCVDGQVESCPAARQITAAGTLYPGGHVFSDADRRDAVNSLNFAIVGTKADTLLTPGTHSFDFAVVPAGDPNVFPAIHGHADGDFRESAPLDVLVYPIRLTNQAGAAVLPDAALLPKASDFIRHTYPVDEELVNNLVLPALPFTGLPIAVTADAEENGARLKAARLELTRLVTRRMWLDRIFFSTQKQPAAQTFAAGVVANLLNGTNAIGTPVSQGLLGYTYPSIKGVVVTLDRSARPGHKPVIGSTIAHELGHQLRFGEEYCYDDDGNDTLESPCRVDGSDYLAANPPPQSKEEGSETGNYITEIMAAYDVTPYLPGRKAVFGPPGTPVFSYMGGGKDDNSWSSQAEYEYLYPRLTTPNPPPPPRKIVVVSGTIGINDAITLDPPLVADSEENVDADAVGSDYALAFFDGAGATLASHPFEVSFTVEYLGEDSSAEEPVDVVPFAVSAEVPEGTESIAILHGGNLLGQVRRSADPPTVTIDRVEVAGSRVTIHWTGSDPDNDPLTYTVFFAPAGTFRQAMGYDLTASRFSFDLGDLPVSNRNNFLEVMANDGFHTGAARTRLVVRRGDVNGDGVVDLADAVVSLQAMAGNLVLGIANLPMIFPLADVSGDGLIGLAETYYALNWAAFTGQLTAEMSGSVFVGQAVQLMVRNFVLGPVTVTSSNPQVAVVEGESAPYTVRGISAGDTTITVTDASETSATLAISVRMP